MKTLVLLVITLISASNACQADEAVIKSGMNFDVAAAKFEEAGFKKTVLAMQSAKDGVVLRFWSVGQGVLIADHHRDENVIRGLTYWFSDGRAKAERVEIELTIKEFNVKTGEMIIVVPLPSANDDE